MEIRKENLDKLKCTFCNKYLSYFPIKLTNANESICGRCSGAYPNENTLRVTTYELLAEYMLFPCSFDGCLATLKPSEVCQHELSCCFRKIRCLFQQDCIFYGSNDEFYQHCNDVHALLKLANFEFEIELIAPYVQNNFLNFNNQLFIFKRIYDNTTNLLTCSVVGIDVDLPYKYQMIIKNGKRDVSVDFEMKQIQHYTSNEIIHTEIAIEDVLKQLNHPSLLIATIKIIENQEESSNGLELKIHHEMLKELECPVCFEYMLPPIKLCEIGHSICSDCLQNIQECPLCRSNFKREQRNITLESMANRLNFPCKYSERGCSFVSNLNSMKQHQEFCKLAPRQCLLHDYVECDFNGSEEELAKHICDTHHDNNIYNNQIDTYISDTFLNEEFKCCYILNFFGRLFKLHHLYKNNRFYWSMQFNGLIDKPKSFNYEIDFIDNNGNNHKMTFRDLCTSLIDKNECFNDGNRFIVVESSQIERFIADNTLSYRIHIIKY